MTGFGAFFAKEILEIRRTWRAWVVPGLLLFFGVTSPILALVTPSLLASVAGSQPGLVIQMPEPTAADASAQFLKNLSQIVLFALVIAAAGAVSGERSSGTAIIALAKPLSRPAFVLGKLIADLLLLVGATIAGTLACGTLTLVLFRSVDWKALVAAVALWLVLAMLVTAVVHLCSVVFRSRGAAAGAGLTFLFLLLLAGIWPPARMYSFVGLTSAFGEVLGGRPVAWGWPVTTAVVALVVCAYVAIRQFEHQEL